MKARASALALAVAAVVIACSDAYLYDERRDDQLPVDRSFAIQGKFCTPGTNEVVRPIKILLAMDASQSMRVSDPDGSRARALIELMNTLPNDPEIYISVMLFAGSTTAFLNGNGDPAFTQLNTMTDADRLLLIDKLLNFTSATPNRDSTDFVKALADIYAMLNQDIANSRLTATGSDADARARYSIIFLSDGHPTSNQDDELLQGDAVVRIRQLKDLAEDVRFNTVHVFNPAQPLSTVCDLSGDAGTGCPLLIINQDTERLDAMARLGGGDFRDFRNNEPINFLNFRFGLTRRAFVVKEMVASNLSAPPSSSPDAGDSDSDGLLDEEEADENTHPRLKDTDGDGFSDGVEVRFGRLGAPFTPNGPVLVDGGGGDPGCPPALRGVDSDCDGLNDCDEQLVGSNAQLTDSDFDGIPDNVEWLLGSQASSDDLGVAELGGVGFGAGYNDLWLSVAMVPGDDPTARTLVRQFRYTLPRYPVGGIKSPVDGVITVAPEELVDRCLPPRTIMP